jgi:hypothetical protein
VELFLFEFCRVYIIIGGYTQVVKQLSDNPFYVIALFNPASL